MPLTAEVTDRVFFPLVPPDYDQAAHQAAVQAIDDAIVAAVNDAIQAAG